MWKILPLLFLGFPWNIQVKNASGQMLHEVTTESSTSFNTRLVRCTVQIGRENSNGQKAMLQCSSNTIAHSVIAETISLPCRDYNDEAMNAVFNGQLNMTMIIYNGKDAQVVQIVGHCLNDE